MSHVATSQRIVKFILLSLLCFDSVFSATTETVQILENEDEDIYGEYKDILRFDFFRYTTRKRYIWEDYTVPTRDYEKYSRNDSSDDYLLYVLVPIFVIGCIVITAYYCIKNAKNDCCSFESDSDSSRSANMYTTVHRPPERRRDLTAQMHRPPTGRNQNHDSRRELFGESARSGLFNELDSNRGTADTTGVTIAFIHSPQASSSQSRREPVNTIAEKPPDYSTVTLNDLVNPNKPAFPIVKTDKETPPPDYGKDNIFFK